VSDRRFAAERGGEVARAIAVRDGKREVTSSAESPRFTPRWTLLDPGRIAATRAGWSRRTPGAGHRRGGASPRGSRRDETPLVRDEPLRLTLAGRRFAAERGGGGRLVRGGPCRHERLRVWSSRRDSPPDERSSTPAESPRLMPSGKARRTPVPGWSMWIPGAGDRPSPRGSRRDESPGFTIAGRVRQSPALPRPRPCGEGPTARESGRRFAAERGGEVARVIAVRGGKREVTRLAESPRFTPR
jgi:hypothetical protein